MKILRTFARVYADRLDDVVSALQAVSGEPVQLRFALPNGLELAAVGDVLVVAGDREVLAPYRSTQATVIVDDLDECRRRVEAAGGVVVRGPKDVPTGRNLTAELPTGIRIEYVQWHAELWASLQ
jgi:hypothetical protein